MKSGDRLLVIVTTTSSKEEAEKIGSALVEEGLAACCQISGPILSIYPWKGKIERDEEWVVSIKTLQKKYSECESRIAVLHSYECPQIVAIPVEETSVPYWVWVRAWVEERRS